MDPALREGYETCRRMLRRHDPTYYFATRRLPRRAAPRHARAVRLRAHGRPDRRRPAPAGHARRRAAPRWTPGRPSSQAGRATRCQPIVARARRRRPTATRCRSASCGTYMRSMRDRLRARCGSAAGRSSCAYMDGSAGSVGRIMAPLLGVPARHHADLGRLGLAFQLANFIRDVREDRRAGPHLPARRGPRALRRQRGRPGRARASPEVRALLAHEVERARALFAAAAPGDRRRARVGAPRRALRASALYPRMLDRVEARGFDVLGRRPACASGTCRARRGEALPVSAARRCAAPSARRSPRAPTC